MYTEIIHELLKKYELANSAAPDEMPLNGSSCLSKVPVQNI